jgi:HipA-like protein
MLNNFKNWFSQSQHENAVVSCLPKNAKATFELKIDKVVIAQLKCNAGEWQFEYTDEFKQLSDRYSTIVGFSNLDKVYRSHTLWPFFQIRIPGLKQPIVKEILQREKIDPTDELALLKRFGHRTVSNPYRLDLVL